MSNVLIREWTGEEKVGIWENCRWSVRLYEDRAICKSFVVRWGGNTGSLGTSHERHTGVVLETLKRIAREEGEDSADYTERVYDFIVCPGC